jgi:hypothetical protein
MRTLGSNIYMYRTGKIYKEPPLEEHNTRKEYYTSNKGDTPKLSPIRDAKYISWCQRFKFVKCKISN